jgi:hypothetical protein
MITITKPVNYLQNKTLLQSIARSKNSYSWFKTPEDVQYDLIIDRDSLQEALAAIGDSAVELATKNRTARTGTTPQRGDLVFRVMTDQHIPPEAMELRSRRMRAKAKRKLEEDYSEDDEDENIDAGLNFPPFQHYRFNGAGGLECVGRSHWLDGKFSSTHGQIDDELARAWIQLVERYSTKFNFRSYSYIDEMRAHALIQLTQVGLKFNEAKSDNPFAYLTAIVNNAFIRQLKKEKIQGDIKNELREYAGLDGSFDRQAGWE